MTWLDGLDLPGVTWMADPALLRMLSPAETLTGPGEGVLGEEPGAGPDRKKYEITPAGQQRVEQWLHTPDVPSPTLQSELFAKTVIALLVDDDAQRLLDVQRAEHMARMRELTRLKREGDLLQVLMCDHGLFHIEADLRWIELTGARLTHLKKELTNA